MKDTKQQAAYVPHAKRNHCETCAHYRGGACTEVQGQVNPDATCMHFEKKGKK